MKKTITLISLMIFTGVLLADWEPGDEHKMHFPQLPDPNGWDVNCTYPDIVADDWQCSESGFVNDVHIWVSWKEDMEAPISRVHLSIHDDVPVGPNGWSEPGNLLWEQDFDPGQFSYILYGDGQQGWVDPIVPSYNQYDHIYYYQINITDIQAPFYQEEGNIYWLDVSIEVDGFQSEEIGWKTSQDHWNDDSVFWYSGQWWELLDPITSESLDQAFVISGGDPVPVELSSLAAFYHDGTPTLAWITQTESDNLGWNVYRSDNENFDESFQVNSNLIPGAGTTLTPTEYTFVDENEVAVNNTYWYWIESKDESGATDYYGPISLIIPESGDNPDALIIEGSLHNYPNPFYPQTEIKFNLPEPANVEVTIYNTKGQKIQTIYNGYCNDDVFRTTWNAENMTSGVYMYLVTVGDNTFSGKMILTE